MRISAWLLMVPALVLAGCGGPAAPASSPATASSPARPSAAASAAAASASAPAKPSAAPAASVGAAANKLTMVYGTNSGETTPVWVAVDQGLFKKYGVDVTASYAQGSLAADSLVSGTAQAGFMGGADAMTMMTAGNGTPVKILFVLVKENPYAIVVRPEIKDASDLKGKTLAIGKLGDTSDISAHIALSRFGIDPGKDVVELQIGNSPARFAALQSGQVAAAIEDQAFTDMLVKQGMHVLVSLAKENVPYIANSLVVTTKYEQQQPSAVAAMVHALYDGLQYTLDSSHRQQVVGTMAKYERADPNSSELTGQYDSLIATEARDPTPEVAGAETILKALQSLDQARYSKLTAAEVIDPSYMQKLKGG